MIIELTEEEVLESLKTSFGFPPHATMKVTVGRGANSSKFTVDIPAIKNVESEMVAEEPVINSSLFESVE